MSKFIKQSGIPVRAEKLLRVLLNECETRFLLGDYEELFKDMTAARGAFIAGCWYWWQIALLLPGSLLDSTMWSVIMLKNYLKIAFRNLFKHKAYSLITISGLAVGLALFILAVLYCDFNLTYNHFHKDVERIYTLGQVNSNGRHYLFAPTPMATVLKTEIPAIEAVTRYGFTGQMKVQYLEQEFFEERIRRVDAPFLTLFTFPLLMGDPESALDDPDAVVITEEIAEKYFGNQDPLGKTLLIDGQAYKVTGVTKKVPDNSSLTFNFLIPFPEEDWTRAWENWSTTFIKVQKDAQHSMIDGQLMSIFEKHIADEKDRPRQAFLFPFKNLFFMPMNYGSNFSRQPKFQYTLILGLASALLLVVCINFMNLATARYINRAREVGLRKVVGAYRRQLIKQFLGESLLITFMALPLALLIYTLFLPTFLNFMRLTADLSIWSNLRLLGIILGVTLSAGLISGSYPAIFLSSVQPVTMLRGRLTAGINRGRLRKALVSIQYILGIVLIVLSIVVTRHFYYLTHIYLGFDRENMVYIEFPGESREKIDWVKNELEKNPAVTSLAKSVRLPVDWGSGYGSKIIPEGQSEENFIRAELYPASCNFIETLQIPLLNGRTFAEDRDDENSAVITRGMAELLPFSDPIGRKIHIDEWEGRIIGIVDDFHFNHVFNKMTPAMFYLRTENFMYLLAKIQSGSHLKVQEDVRAIWERLLPEYPQETFLLEDYFIESFKSTVKGKELIALLSFVSIFFSCLGLLGLASFTVERKTKEIAIRKVLGATIRGVTGMLLYKFMFLVALSNIIALPLAYFAADWFINFGWVDRIPLTSDIFIIAVLIAFGTAIFAVITQTIRAAVADPSAALRVE